MLRQSSLVFLFLILFSCSGDSDNPVDDRSSQDQDTDDEVEVLDEIAPEILISDISGLVEVKTDIDITVSDESDEVVTSITVNGEEVFSTTEKDFVYVLNPFEYSTGMKEVIVTSLDANGNKGTQSVSFELKKLLFRHPSIAGQFDSSLIDAYISVNKKDGKLIHYKKIEDQTLPIEFYADDQFNEDEIVATLYGISNETHYADLNFIFSYSHIIPGTTFLTSEERGALFQYEFIPPSRNLQKTITVNGASYGNMHGFTGYTYKAQPNLLNYEYTFFYADVDNVEHFFYNFLESGNELEDYSYLIIDDVTINEYELTDLIKPEGYYQLQLPNGLSYELLVNAYESEEAYDRYEYHQIFKKVNGLINSSPYEENISFPLIEKYPFYQKKLSVQMDEVTRLTLNQKGLKPFQFMDVNATYNNGSVTTRGEYNVYQYGFNNLDSWQKDASNVSLTIWSFYGKKQQADIDLPFDDFEIPDEIVASLILNGANINPSDDGIDEFYLELTGYEKETFLYEGMVFNYGSPRNEFGDNYSYRIELKE